MKIMKPSLAFVLVAGLLLFSELTLGHGSEKHAEENHEVEQSPAANSAASISSDNQLIAS